MIAADNLGQEYSSVECGTDSTLNINIQAVVHNDKPTLESPVNKEARNPYRITYSKQFKNQPEPTYSRPQSLASHEFSTHRSPKAPLKTQIFSFMKKSNTEGRETVSKLPAFNSSRMNNPSYRSPHLNILKQKNYTNRKTERDKSFDIRMIQSKEFKFVSPQDSKPFKLVHLPLSRYVASQLNISRINSLEYLLNTTQVRRRNNLGL